MALTRARVLAPVDRAPRISFPAPASSAARVLSREAADAVAAIVATRAQRRQDLEERESTIIDVARALAERLLGRALALDPGLVVDLAREALATASRARSVELRAHPDDAVILRARLAELALTASDVTVVDDATRARGALLAETDLGTFDADPALALERLADVLRR